MGVNQDSVEFKLGYLAYHQGLTEDDNPHMNVHDDQEFSSQQDLDWHQGFIEAWLDDK